jgi:outer membrane protein insertion porin family
VTVPLALLGLTLAPAETVRSVRLFVADPARYERYVDIKRGQPLDPAAVRRTVTRLFATGEFADVVVESEPGPEGLDVRIRPKPAPLFSEAVVRGDKVKSASALRKITRLRRGEPLWPARLERAGKEAALALSAAGYLEATVTVEAMPTPAGTVAQFTVHAGPRARVGKLRVVGEDTRPPLPLEPLAHPTPGQVYERARAEKAADAMRRSLFEVGRWRARVEVAESYDPGSAIVDLSFRVTSGESTTLEIRGADVPRGLRNSIVQLLRETSLRSDAIEEAGEKLEEHFRGHGYREVTTRHVMEQRRPGAQNLVYVVVPGPATYAASVRVVGDPEPLPAPRTTPGLPVVDRVLEEDVHAMTRALEDRGHLEPQVEVEAEGGGDVPVVFRVRPGRRTLVSGVSIEAPSLPASTEKVKELRLRAGQPYRIRDLAADRTTLLTAWRDAGYPSAAITPEVTFSEDGTEARVRFRVEPGPRRDVGEIVVAGLRRTREEVVRREMLVKEGEPLGQQALLESQRRLAALGIFDRLDVSELDPESTGAHDLLAALHEAPVITLAYGLGYGERDRVRASLEATRRNMFGMDRTLTAFVRGSFKGSRFLLSYREPRLFGRQTNLFVTGFWEEEDRVSFSYNRVGAVVQVAKPFARSHLNLIGRFGVQATHTFDVQVPIEDVDRQFRTYTFAGPSASVVFETRDDPLEPHRGTFLSTDLSLSMPLLGAARFAKGYFQVATYEQLNPRTVFALAARFGLARTYGIGEPLALPLPERFFLGGAYGLRGYEEDSVGPRAPSSDGTLVPTGGNALVYAGAELRFDAARSLSLAAFAEAGGIYLFISDLDLGQLRYTAGLGLRYKTPFGPLRLDWGYKLNRPLGESTSRFHFTIGHAF